MIIRKRDRIQCVSQVMKCALGLMMSTSRPIMPIVQMMDRPGGIINARAAMISGFYGQMGP